MSELLEKIRIELEKALTGRPYLFRTDKTRQALDGNSAGVMANFDQQESDQKEPFLLVGKLPILQSTISNGFAPESAIR